MEWRRTRGPSASAPMTHRLEKRRKRPRSRGPKHHERAATAFHSRECGALSGRSFAGGPTRRAHARRHARPSPLSLGKPVDENRPAHDHANPDEGVERSWPGRFITDRNVNMREVHGVVSLAPILAATWNGKCHRGVQRRRPRRNGRPLGGPIVSAPDLWERSPGRNTSSEEA